MKNTISIDSTGRLVIPKPLRDRLGLRGGTELSVTEDHGRIVLTPHTRAPRVIEEKGRLLVDPGSGEIPVVDHLAGRDERLRSLVQYALER